MTATIQVENGDWVFSESSGRPLLLTDTAKLRQDVRENFETEPQVDGTGAGLDSIVGLVGDRFGLQAEISRRIEESLQALRALQQRIQRFDRTRKERVFRTVSVFVSPIRNPDQDVLDPTSFAYKVGVLSEDKLASPSQVTGFISS